MTLPSFFHERRLIWLLVIVVAALLVWRVVWWRYGIGSRPTEPAPAAPLNGPQ